MQFFKWGVTENQEMESERYPRFPYHGMASLPAAAVAIAGSVNQKVNLKED